MTRISPLLATAAAVLAAPALAQAPSAGSPGYGPAPELPAPDASHQVERYSTQRG